MHDPDEKEETEEMPDSITDYEQGVDSITDEVMESERDQDEETDG